jgi:membrane protein DedA with SNARE-associated domain
MSAPVVQIAEMPAALRNLLDSEYALLVLLCVFVLEGAMLMYFMPSEAIVPVSIGLMGSTVTDVATIVGVAVVGATIGQVVLFVLAKRGGRKWLLEKRWFRVSDERLATFDGWFDRWGPIVVPVSNALLFTRGMLTVPAGFAGMRTREFVVLSAAGTVVFETALAAIALGVIEVAF